MAIAFEVIYTIEDEDGDRATTSIKVPTGFSLAQYGQFGAALATLMDAFIGGLIVGADFCLTADLSGVTNNTVAATSDVEDIGAFQFRTVDIRPVKVNVPGLSEGLVAPASDDIDQADLAIAAFIGMMEVGIAVTGGTIQPCDVGEDDIVYTEYARERFRASGRRS